MATIVVGVDGSDSAQEALHFAVQEARLRGAGVRAVMGVYLLTMAYGGMTGWGSPRPPPPRSTSRWRARDGWMWRSGCSR